MHEFHDGIVVALQSGLARAGPIVGRPGPTGPNLDRPRPTEVCASVFGRSSTMICRSGPVSVLETLDFGRSGPEMRRSGPVSVLDSVWTELCSMR